MEFLSECCDAAPIGELDKDNELGFCGKCFDKACFYENEYEPFLKSLPYLEDGN